MTKKYILKALDSFKKQEKYKNHEGLTIGMLWIHEFITYLLLNQKKDI